jgi:hypothetical protein
MNFMKGMALLGNANSMRLTACNLRIFAGLTKGIRPEKTEEMLMDAEDMERRAAAMENTAMELGGGK